MIYYVLMFIFISFLGTFLGYVFHTMFHKPWSGRFYKAHMTHHEKLYPVNDFLSDEYRDPGKDNTVWLFLLMFSPLAPILFALVFYSIIPLPMGIMALIEMILIGWVNNNMHNGFHLRKSRWDKFKFYARLRKLHYQHHIDMNSNFGIYSYMWDRIFGSFIDIK